MRVDLDVRQKMFTMRVVRHWMRLHSKVLDAPSLDVFSGQVGWGFEQPDLVGGISAHVGAGGRGGELELGDHYVSFQPKLFYGPTYEVCL